MTESEQNEIRKIILSKIEDTREEIVQLTELTKPIAPDNAYGRLSRMDAINNKTINEAGLREQKSRLQKLERALSNLDEGKYGNCRKCNDSIPLGRLTFVPWTNRCVKCA